MSADLSVPFSGRKPDTTPPQRPPATSTITVAQRPSRPAKHPAPTRTRSYTPPSPPPASSAAPRKHYSPEPVTDTPIRNPLVEGFKERMSASVVVWLHRQAVERDCTEAELLESLVFEEIARTKNKTKSSV